MALKYAHESIDEIPETFRDLYAEVDGRYVLSGVEGVKSVEDVERVSEALRKEREDHKKARDKLRSWDGFDPEDVKSKLTASEKIENEKRELEAKLAELAAATEGKLDSSKVEELLEQRLKLKTEPLVGEKTRLEKTLKTIAEERDTLAKTNAELTATLNQIRVETQLKSAAAAANVRPEALDDFVLIACGMVELSESGDAVVRDGLRDLSAGASLKTLIKELQKTRPYFWPDSEGAGAGGSKRAEKFTDNPWAKESFNLTKQGQMFRDNPEVARKMAAAAGVRL